MRVASSLCYFTFCLQVTLGFGGHGSSWFGSRDTGVRSAPSGCILLPSTELPLHFLVLLLASLFYIWKLLRMSVRGFGRSRHCLGRRKLKRLRRCAPQVLRRCLAQEAATTRATNICIRLFPYMHGRGVSFIGLSIITTHYLSLCCCVYT